MVEVETEEKNGEGTTEEIYPLEDPKRPYMCSPNCKMPHTKYGCLGCPLA